MGQYSTAGLVETLHRLEQPLLDLPGGDAQSTSAKLHALLDDAFTEIGASGTTYDKRATIVTLLTSPHIERAMSDFTIHLLAPGVVLASYVVTVESTGARSARSSIWRESPDGWRIVFHQGTPLAS